MSRFSGVSSKLRRLTTRRCLVTALTGVIAALGQPALAQTVSPFVGGMFRGTLDPAGHRDSPYLDSGLGGAALSGGVTAGVSLPSGMTIGGELSIGGTVTGLQSARIPDGQAHFARRHDDIMLMGVLRGRLSERVWGVVGIGVVRVRTDEVRTDRTFDGRLIAGPLTREYRWWSPPGVVFGLDYRLIRHRDVTLIATGRLYFADRDRGIAGDRLGLGTFVLRPALTVLFGP